MSSSVVTRRPDVLAPDVARTGIVAPSRRAGAIAVVVLAAVTVAAWLPFLHHPLSSDESGFWLLAHQWRPGSSLYGDYWVDRPPLLLALFDLAGRLAPAANGPAGLTAPALRLLGAGASGLTVLLSGVLGRVVAPRSRWWWVPSLVVAALLASPLFGMPETDGEVLAVPFVVLGLACVVSALRRPWGRRALALSVAAGAAGTGAALVKQNIVDVFVFALVLLLVASRTTDRPGARAGAFGAGAAGVLVATLTGAALRGTAPARLWDAVVVFRLQASAVIGSSASQETSDRMSRMVSAFLVSGAVAILVLTVVLALTRRGRRGSGGLVWPALAMTAWELCGAAMGGSYWLHYLTGLVPGLVLLTALARPRRRPALVLAAVLVYVCATSATLWAQHVARPVSVSPDAQVVSYLRGHAAPSDGVVVAFGHPGIVAGSGLTSPYEHLWSLPVRVRDPRLTELESVMAGARAPRWVVVSGARLDSWGLDARSAQAYLEGHYVERQAYGDWHIWQRAGGAAS